MHAPQVRMLSLSVVWWHVGCVGCSEMMEMTLIIEQQQQQQQVTTPVSSQGITTTTSDVERSIDLVLVAVGGRWEVERSIVVVMLLVFSVVGVAGNVVVLVVFSRRGDHLASTVFIVVLAVVDFTTCLIVAPFTVFIELVRYNVGADVVCKLYQVGAPPLQQQLYV